MAKTDTDFDLLIPGGKGVTETEPVIGDVGIRNGRVTAIGSFQGCVARDHINANGLSSSQLTGNE